MSLRPSASVSSSSACASANTPAPGTTWRGAWSGVVCNAPRAPPARGKTHDMTVRKGHGETVSTGETLLNLLTDSMEQQRVGFLDAGAVVAGNHNGMIGKGTCCTTIFAKQCYAGHLAFSSSM